MSRVGYSARLPGSDDASPTVLIIDLTQATFGAFIAQQARPVLVTFSGAGCSRCRNLLPLLRELALNYRNQAAFAKVDVDADPALTAAYAITTLPTIVLFQNGEHSTVLAGSGGRPELLAALQRQLTGPSHAFS